MLDTRPYTTQLRLFPLRFSYSHSGATGVFLPICRVVNLRCATTPTVTDASIKNDVRRLKVGGLLIQMLVHCALICLVGIFLVLGRSWSASQ